MQEASFEQLRRNTEFFQMKSCLTEIAASFILLILVTGVYFQFPVQVKALMFSFFDSLLMVFFTRD